MSDLEYNIDLKGRRRGKCSCGKCEEYFLRNKDIFQTGWCQYCNHPPTEQEDIQESLRNTIPVPSVVPGSSKETAASSPEICESSKNTIPVPSVVPGSSKETAASSPQICEPSKESSILEIDDSPTVLGLSDEEDAGNNIPSGKKASKHIPLPEFSKVLKPLLDGDILSSKDHGVLSSILKEELIAHLNRENLICSGNSSMVRWEYRNLGEALASKYPKLMFDLPSSRQKKPVKENVPIYSVFIRRLALRRKMKRLREKVKEEAATELPVNIEFEIIEVSPEDAADELKSVTSDAAQNSENTERIAELIKISYCIRAKEEFTELPPFLMAQTYLETEVELRLERSMDVMEKKLEAALNKMASTYSVPGNVQELEKLMQPKRATWSAVTIGDYTSDVIRPGPSLFYGNKKSLLCGAQVIHLEKNCSLERGTILLLGIYYILNLTFPASYGQFLGLLQNILVEKKKFPKVFSSNHLIQVTKALLLE